MGYHSDVFIRVTTDPPEKFKVLLMEMLLIKPEWWNKTMEHQSQCEKFTIDEAGVYCHIQGWKWYDTFGEVQAFEDMHTYFVELANEDDCINVCYLRIGEDVGDVTELFENNGHDLGYIYNAMEIAS
jgi:hypothetical protein